MEYASTAFDRELLNTQRNWLAANQTTGDLGDDLRFSKALSAQKGYEVDAMELEQQLIPVISRGINSAAKFL